MAFDIATRVMAGTADCPTCGMNSDEHRCTVAAGCPTCGFEHWCMRCHNDEWCGCTTCDDRDLVGREFSTPASAQPAMVGCGHAGLDQEQANVSHPLAAVQG